MTSPSNKPIQADSVLGTAWLTLLVPALLLGILSSGNQATASIALRRHPSNPSNPVCPPTMGEYQDAEGKKAEPALPIRESSPRPARTTLSESDLLKSRMKAIGWCCLGILGVIVVAFVYFRLNHATRGVYSRRLLMFAIMVSVFVILAIALTLQTIWR